MLLTSSRSISLSTPAALGPRLRPGRFLATAARTQPSPPRPNRYANDSAKAGGDISDAFSSMSGGGPATLPPRYAELKRTLAPTLEARQGIEQAWGEVLRELRILNPNVKDRGGDTIPYIRYEDLVSGELAPEEIEEFRSVGTVIVKGAVPEEEALKWKADIQEYAKVNADKATGFPPENPQVWEFYHSKSQLRARTHPNILTTQQFLLEQWTADSTSEVAFDSPLSYFDRLRIRFPGDSKFALGPHVDGGSVERWEDPTYRKSFSKLLTPSWEDHNPFDGTNRINAIMDMYKGQGACNVFRPWQGWVSMSTTRANEGTLRVFPNILLSSAYIILRPFFKPIKSLSDITSSAPSVKVGKGRFLAPSNWTFDSDSVDFPGSVPGSGQELSDTTHPHLELEDCMISLPLVEPGDQVYWHCDVIHAVEPVHNGKGDSSVMYIPTVPLTENNAEYLAAERAAFLAGYPPFDFSGGEGETHFEGRATREDVFPEDRAQRAMGFKPFEAPYGATEAQKNLVRNANAWLF